MRKQEGSGNADLFLDPAGFPKLRLNLDSHSCPNIYLIYHAVVETQSDPSQNAEQQWIIAARGLQRKEHVRAMLRRSLSIRRMRYVYFDQVDTGLVEEYLAVMAAGAVVNQLTMLQPGSRASAWTLVWMCLSRSSQRTVC